MQTWRKCCARRAGAGRVLRLASAFWQPFVRTLLSSRRLALDAALHCQSHCGAPPHPHLAKSEPGT